MSDQIRTLLDIAEELDQMDRDVSSWEADFLESVLKRLRSGQALSDKQVKALQGIHRKYLGEGAAPEESDGGED